ncbi:helix-turn-helix transcriptional regulator [Microbacterium oxydans]|uniref:Virulence regulon transcriptional activator VirF n=1 Tax=Microbacterium oxydans TaxID=82380 RepID=A0A0F0L6N0_9MICO|nr:AraC family transcriptional regulator [Microbacterium oxydans]KJL28349.1 Virulence regulon transcriptional activator VirF [Microbacterium oxydans]
MTERVRAWHPAVPAVREVYHAAFGHAYPMHAHDGWAVMLVDEGAVAYDLDKAGHFATPQALTLLPPGIPHDGRSTIDGAIYRKRVLYLDSTWLPERAPGAAAGHPTLADTEALVDAKRIHAALREPGDLMAAEHWTLTLQRRILAHLGAPTAALRDAPMARRVRELLDARYTESFTIAEIEAELGAHPSHLARVFSQTYGLAPHQYVVSRRVDLARRLLVDGSRPAAAAVDAGFHDQAHMTRHFRRVLGATPGAFADLRRPLG